MSNEWLDIIGKIALFVFVVFIVFLFADLTMRLTWNKIYFTIGVPIFSMRIPVKMPHSNTPSQSLFQAQFRTRWIRSFAFKEIDYCILGFREIFFETPWVEFPFVRRLGYHSLMHGLLIFDNENQEVIVKGIANWSVLWLTFWLTLASSTIIIALVLFPINTEGTIEVIGTILIITLPFGYSYAAQRTRFSRIAEFAAHIWSRQYVLNNSEG